MASSVFNYIDYRKFLADYYTAEKLSHSFFSYQYMAHRVRMDTSNLAKVLLGKRHVPRKSIANFKDLCKFSDHEYEYFTMMIDWSKARSEKRARDLFDRLTGMQGSQPHVLDAMQYDYYRRWYHVAIYSMLDFIDFRGNFRTLASRLDPAITIEEARHSIALLVKLGLVTVTDQGRYVPVRRTLSTGERWQSYAVHQFQKETLRLAARSLDEHDKGERDVSTLTFGASPADLAALKKLTRDYRRSIIELINAGSAADRVYQLNLQLFPVTSKREHHEE
jgi:uncharacterized protein (TIGR02147 family)